MNAGRTIVLLALLFASGLLADAPLPIDLRADRLELNVNGGQQVLSGNVVVEQGSLIISADKLQVDLNKGAITRISGSGSPIVVSDNTPSATSLRASARSINYETSTWKLVIEGEVTLERPGWRVRGDRLVYDIRKARYILTGKRQSQVQTTLQPIPADK